MNRIDIIKRNISEEYKLLAFYEEDLVTADDPKRIMRHEKAIAQSKSKIDEWHKELEYLSTKPAEELTHYNNQNVDLEFEYDFFLSFSSRNIDTVYKIYEVFQRYQLRVFISEITLKSLGGTSFFDKINHALNSSKHFVLLCTPEAMQSQWVKNEFQAFYHNFTMHNPDGRKFFVMRGPGFHQSLVPLLLSVIQLVDSAEQIIHSLNIKPVQEITKTVEPIAHQQNADEQEAERKRQQEAKRLKQQADDQLKVVQAKEIERKKNEANKPQTPFWIEYKKQLTTAAAVVAIVLLFLVFKTIFSGNYANKQIVEEPQQIAIAHYDSLSATFDLPTLRSYLKTDEAHSLNSEYKQKANKLLAQLVEDSISKNKTNTNKELTTEVIQEIPPKNITNNNKTKTETNLTDLNFDMVYVRGGTFTMGSNEGDADEKPTHQVTLSDFYIGKYEVTQKQWKALMGTNPSEFKGDNLPVEKVSWNDVQEFIKKLNAKTGKKYSLPTEAQWEYAAGGGANNRTKWAGTNSESSVGTYIWYDGNSGNKTYPIGTKNPNQLGIYDMSGNVWEWCLDWYGNYSSASQTNPKGAQSGTHRIGRGGGWGDYNPYCRVTNRSKGIPTNTINDLGFRIVFIP